MAPSKSNPRMLRSSVTDDNEQHLQLSDQSQRDCVSQPSTNRGRARMMLTLVMASCMYGLRRQRESSIPPARIRVNLRNTGVPPVLDNGRLGCCGGSIGRFPCTFMPTGGTPIVQHSRDGRVPMLARLRLTRMRMGGIAGYWQTDRGWIVISAIRQHRRLRARKRSRRRPPHRPTAGNAGGSIGKVP